MKDIETESTDSWGTLHAEKYQKLRIVDKGDYYEFHLENPVPLGNWSGITLRLKKA